MHLDIVTLKTGARQKENIRSLITLKHRPIERSSSYDYNARAMTAGGFGTSGRPSIEIRGFSLSNLVLGVGFVATSSSFAEYVANIGGLSSLGFVYGLPIMLVGAALKYGEILPVPIRASDEAIALFELKKTETIANINKDVTRHRYGDEAHLDSTLKALGLALPGKAYPQLEYLQYNISEENELEFMMVWKSIDTPFRIWNETARLNKYDIYFGPDIWSQVVKVSGPKRLVGIKLTTKMASGNSIRLPTNSTSYFNDSNDGMQ